MVNIIKLIIYIFYLLSSISCDVNADKERVRKLYGENKEITGEYDINLSVTCNNGVYVGLKKDDILSFKGIPYAQPPIGNLRWKNPKIAEDSNKVYEAYYFGKSCIQTEWPSELASYYPISEDCLKLNVWLNTKNDLKNKTVMVFIHGGAYDWGGTSDPMYDGHNLIQKYDDIILITITYRLGLLGFINFDSVPGGEEYNTSKNLGLLDQICALKWIQKNIDKFGGDPNKVTIIGESAGAGSVSLLPLMKETKGLFKRIIAESGSINLSYSKEETKLLIENLLKESEGNNMQDLLSLSEDKIKEINEEITDYYNFPIRDDYIIPIDLYNYYKEGYGKDIDMLLGSNKDEVRYWIKEMEYSVDILNGEILFKYGIQLLYENDLKKISKEDKKYVDKFMNLLDDERHWKISEFYNELLFRIPMNKQAEYHSNNGGNTYVYHWTYPGEDETMGACHAIELSYIFNNLQEKDYTGNKINQALADEVQEMWINFARYGNPSTNKTKWEKYDSIKRKTMILGDEIKMVEDYKRVQRLLIEPLLKYYFNGNYQDLSLDVPIFYKILAVLIAIFLGIIGIIAGIIYLIVKIVKKKKLKLIEENKDENSEKDKSIDEKDEDKDLVEDKDKIEKIKLIN
jgi:para-nitrobenzyl esterase